MTKITRHCSSALLACAAALIGATAFAQQSYPPPGTTLSARDQSCQRLEAQLGAIDRGSSDPARAEQVRQLEATLGRQQAELDRMTQQSRRQGCETSGFFQIFGGAGRSEQCGPLNNQITQVRANLSRVQNDLQRLQSSGANYERDGQRRAVLAALVQNDCGPQYRAQAAQSRNLFETLFGSGPGPGAEQNNPSDGGAGGSGYRTVCVRTCDGYFFPISFSTSQDRFRDDEATCQRMCPASEVALYSHRNPGEDMRQAVSANGGKLYTELPTAFKYKTEWSNACVCKQANESWANAVKDDPASQSAVDRNDVVSEERAKILSAPRDAKGRPILPPAQKGAQKGAASAAGPAPVAAQPAPPPPDQPEGEKKPIRSVGPKFLSQ